MRIVFFIPLGIIALYETVEDGKDQNGWMATWLRSSDIDDNILSDDDAKDPKVDHDGLQISKVPFKELIKAFPNISQVRFIVCVYLESACY
jgi:hypothetical protein